MKILMVGGLSDNSLCLQVHSGICQQGSDQPISSLREGASYVHPIQRFHSGKPGYQLRYGRYGRALACWIPVRDNGSFLGKEPQHIILHQKFELKQHRLTFFIQQSRQLVNVNFIAVSLDRAVGLKPKSEFLKIEGTKPAPADDDAEAMSRRGYTRPKLTFDWSE